MGGHLLLTNLERVTLKKAEFLLVSFDEITHARMIAPMRLRQLSRSWLYDDAFHYNQLRMGGWVPDPD
jgi:hypothetical protein